MWRRESYSCPNSLQHAGRLGGLLIANSAIPLLCAAGKEASSLRINSILTVAMFEDNIQSDET